ncbi:DUF5133 domain-containing protein [Streptomyces sp. NPDC020801]|uniref:DUF5133 domain-containing protein n=1 Tax=Streptomyces sp. NPDC020801 TaxID=3365093 RepID=UPI0037972AF5
MLIPHPEFLRKLLDEYEAVLAEERAGATGPSVRAQDLAYTLCVSTGTREVTLAVEEARRMLAVLTGAGNDGNFSTATATATATVTAAVPLTV